MEERHEDAAADAEEIAMSTRMDDASSATAAAETQERTVEQDSAIPVLHESPAYDVTATYASASVTAMSSAAVVYPAAVTSPAAQDV